MFIGAVIYLLYGVFAEPAPEADDKTIVVTVGEVEWMQTAWQKRWNRPPTAEEFDGLIQQYIKERKSKEKRARCARRGSSSNPVRTTRCMRGLKAVSPTWRS